MNDNVYVVTDSELGWDNVVAIYDNEEAAEARVESRGGTTSTYDSVLLESTCDE